MFPFPSPRMPADVELMAKQIANLQRAIYYLIWKKSGFGEHCIHCGSQFPNHDVNCKAVEIEALVR